MNHVIYIRTSTEEQNPHNQLSDILTLCPQTVKPEIVEDKQSAWKDIQREGFSIILQKINKREISDLYVWDLDRIYRNRLKIVQFFQQAKFYGCRIHSYRQKWLEDLNQAPSPWNEIMSDLMIQIMGWMAEEESAKKSERIKAAIRTKNGKTVSYNGNRWGRKPLPKQTRDRIIELRKQGVSIRNIAKEIVTWVNGHPKPISKTTVARVLEEDKEEE